MTTRREKSKPQKPQMNKQLESLFNDVTDKTMLYLTGMFIVVATLALGLRLTNKRK